MQSPLLLVCFLVDVHNLRSLASNANILEVTRRFIALTLGDMRLILVRHGQTALNEKNVFRGRLDIPLNETGIQQANAIAERLCTFNINIIYTSPLKRALETAQVIGTKLNINTEIDNNLIDFDFGKWQGLTIGEVEKRFPKLYEQWLKGPHMVKIPDGENLDLVRIRVSKVLNKILRDDGSDMVIVSHRVILKVLICAALSLDNSYFWQVKQNVGAISILDYKKGEFSLSLLNDTCHLGNDEQNKEIKDF